LCNIFVLFSFLSTSSIASAVPVGVAAGTICLQVVFAEFFLLAVNELPETPLGNLQFLQNPVEEGFAVHIV
jgi:hypothetical protein